MSRLLPFPYTPPTGTYSAVEVEEILGAPLASLFEGDASAALVLAAFRDFKLHDRAAHVYSEAARVPAFRDVCLGHGSADEKIAALGKLMDDSQASCRLVWRGVEGGRGRGPEVRRGERG